MAQNLVVNLEHHLQVAEQQREAASCVALCHTVHFSMEGVLGRLEESQTVIEHIYDAHVDFVA